jgi:hypothetical protein
MEGHDFGKRALQHVKNYEKGQYSYFQLPYLLLKMSFSTTSELCRSGKCLIGLTHCPHLPDLLSDRQERDFDSSDVVLKDIFNSKYGN